MMNNISDSNDSYPYEFAALYHLITQYRAFTKDIDDLLANKKLDGLNILDFGCGTGKHLNLLLEKNVKANLLAGYDPSSGFTKLNYKNKQFDFYNNLKNIPVLFDIILSWAEPINFVEKENLEETLLSLLSLTNKNAYWMLEIWNPKISAEKKFEPKTRVFDIPEKSNLYNSKNINQIERICLPNLKLYESEIKEICYGTLEMKYEIYSLPKRKKLSETTHKIYLHNTDFLEKLLPSNAEIKYSRRPNSALTNDAKNINETTIFMHVFF